MIPTAFFSCLCSCFSLACNFQFPGNRREVWTVTLSHSALTDSYFHFVRIGCFGDHRLANRGGCVFPSLSELSTSGLEEACSGVINRRSRDRFKLQVKIHRCSLTHLFHLMTTHLHTNSNSVIVSFLLCEAKRTKWRRGFSHEPASAKQKTMEDIVTNIREIRGSVTSERSSARPVANTRKLAKNTRCWSDVKKFDLVTPIASECQKCYPELGAARCDRRKAHQQFRWILRWISSLSVHLKQIWNIIFSRSCALNLENSKIDLFPSQRLIFLSMFMNDCMWAVIFLRKKEEEYKNILVNHQVNHRPDHYGNSACQTSRSSTCRTTSLRIQFETRVEFGKMEAYVFTGATSRRVSGNRRARVLWLALVRWQTRYVAVSRFQRQLAGQNWRIVQLRGVLGQVWSSRTTCSSFFGVCFQEPPSFSSWSNQPIHRSNTTQSMSRSNHIYEHVQRHRMVEENNEATCLSDAEEVADHANNSKKGTWCFCGPVRKIHGIVLAHTQTKQRMESYRQIDDEVWKFHAPDILHCSNPVGSGDENRDVANRRCIIKTTKTQWPRWSRRFGSKSIVHWWGHGMLVWWVRSGEQGPFLSRCGNVHWGTHWPCAPQNSQRRTCNGQPFRDNEEVRAYTHCHDFVWRRTCSSSRERSILRDQAFCAGKKVILLLYAGNAHIHATVEKLKFHVVFKTSCESDLCWCFGHTGVRTLLDWGTSSVQKMLMGFH